jgi:hypothetical protein
VLRNEALDDKMAALRVKANSERVESHFPYGFPYVFIVIGIVRDLIVSDEEEALVVILEAEPVLQRARVMPEV